MIRDYNLLAKEVLEIASNCKIITPIEEINYLSDSQFVNASEYGFSRLILKNEIGSYMGKKIIIGSNNPKENLNITSYDPEKITKAIYKIRRKYKLNKGETEILRASVIGELI